MYEQAKAVGKDVNEARSHVRRLQGELEEAQRKEARRVAAEVAEEESRRADGGAGSGDGEGVDGASGGGAASESKFDPTPIHQEMARHKQTYQQGFDRLRDMKRRIQA